MNFKRRRGFALIWVVLIGALIFVGIVSLTLRVVPENMITVARTHTQRALSVAEEGTNQVLFDLRNFGTSTDPNYINEFDPNSGSSHYLASGDIISLINASSVAKGEHITNPSPLSDESFETNYQAKIEVISNTYSDEDGVRTGTLNVILYNLGTVSNRANKNVLARKAIKTGFPVDYKIITPQTITDTVTTSSVFDYALFSGENIKFEGSAQTVSGNIHAVGIIDLGNAKNQVRVGGNGDAEAEVNIQGKGIVTGNLIPQASEVPFPEIDIVSYKALADAFRSGTIPYKGTTPNFPDTSNDIVKSVIQSYLGAPGTSSPLDGINNFYNDLKNGTGELAPHPGGLTEAELQNLQTYMKSIVYYVQGPATINGQFACAGTLVVDGDPNQENLIINGNSQVGDPNDRGAAAILVQGSIKMANGTADLYGLFYSTGSLTGIGTFDCEGSIVTKGTIDLNGNYSVTYVPINNPNLGITTTIHETTTGELSYSITSAASGSGTSSYSWKEISFDEFQNP